MKSKTACIEKIRDQHGFTLVELIVALIVMGIISGVIIGVVALNARSINLVSNTTLARYDLRRAMKILRDDIQQIQPAKLVYNGGILPSDQLVYDDLDGNRISYIYSSNAITRNGTSILSHVQQDPFTYLDIDLNVTNVKEDVRFIEVDLQIDYNANVMSLGDRFYVRN